MPLFPEARLFVGYNVPYMLEKLIERTGFTDVFIIIIGSIAMIGFWRGIWGLFDRYLFPGNPDLSYAVSIGIGLVALFIIAWYKNGHDK